MVCNGAIGVTAGHQGCAICQLAKPRSLNAMVKMKAQDPAGIPSSGEIEDQQRQPRSAWRARTEIPSNAKRKGPRRWKVGQESGEEEYK